MKKYKHKYMTQTYYYYYYNPPSPANDIIPTSCLCSYLDSYSDTKMPVLVVGDLDYPHIGVWPLILVHCVAALFLTSVLQNGLTQFFFNFSTCGNIIFLNIPTS